MVLLLSAKGIRHGHARGVKGFGGKTPRRSLEETWRPLLQAFSGGRRGRPPLEKVGRTKPARPTNYARGNVTRARPSSWRPSLPPASGELAILSSRWYGWIPGGAPGLLPGARTRGCLAWFSGRGGDPEGHLVLSRRDLLSNLSGVLEADGLTHLLYLTPCLVHLLGGPQRRTHFGCIRGTPWSTAATMYV